MADAAALVRGATNTTKMASALRNQWDVRTKTRAKINDGAAQEMVNRAQIDEVFLVLAHLGEAVLPLGVFNKDYYLQTLGEVQASISSCGHDLLPMAWEELDAELQYACTAGLTICACYSPIPVYRGFGACVLGDWDWACPDLSYLEDKAKKTAIRTIYGFKQKVDAQPTRSVFTAFDQVVQILQVKAMAFLEKRPQVSSFGDHQPRYQARPKKEVKDDLELFEDWVKQLERRGHPAPKSTKLSSWGIPHATWTSPFSCSVLKTQKDCEFIMCNQMDPGRLLHAFVCRGSLNLDVGQVLLLPPRSSAESLAVWLEGLPGTNHKVVKWEDLDTEYFESKISKSMKKKIGRYPLPTQYAVRHPDASSRPSLPLTSSSRNVLEHPNTVSPPPYSPGTGADSPNQQGTPVGELGHPDPRELAASPADSSHVRPQHASSLPVPGAGNSGLKSIHALRRKTTGGTLGANATQSTSQNMTGSSNSKQSPESQRPSSAVELPEDTAPRELPDSTSPPAVELPGESYSRNQKEASNREISVSPAPGTTSTSTADVKSNEKSNEGPAILSEEPGPITSEATSGVGSSTANNDTQTESGNLYLELLNRIAKGEISPQALGEMLAKGNLSPQSEQPKTTPTTKTSDSEAINNENASSLPYPLSPTERQKNEWAEKEKSAAGVPYPETPVDTTSDANLEDKRKSDALPASLRPGAHWERGNK